MYVVVGEWGWFEGSVVVVGHSDSPNPLWAKLGRIGAPQDGLLKVTMDYQFGFLSDIYYSFNRFNFFHPYFVIYIFQQPTISQ